MSILSAPQLGRVELVAVVMRVNKFETFFCRSEAELQVIIDRLQPLEHTVQEVDPEEPLQEPDPGAWRICPTSSIPRSQLDDQERGLQATLGPILPDTVAPPDLDPDHRCRVCLVNVATRCGFPCRRLAYCEGCAHDTAHRRIINDVGLRLPVRCAHCSSVCVSMFMRL